VAAAPVEKSEEDRVAGWGWALLGVVAYVVVFAVL
jgi:hypothetical protein